MNFFNSTRIDGVKLSKAQGSANRQDLIIYSYFLMHPGKEFTPPEVHQALIEKDQIPESTPLTSIRRSITTLTRTHRLLEKTTIRRPGNLGAVNCTWRLSRGQMSILF